MSKFGELEVHLDSEGALSNSSKPCSKNPILKSAYNVDFRKEDAAVTHYRHVTAHYLTANFHRRANDNNQMSFETPLPPYNASDPHATFLSSSCFDMLLIEMVPLANRMATELSATRKDSTKAIDQEEQREAAFRTLDTLGYRVGQGLVERSVNMKLRPWQPICVQSRYLVADHPRDP
ncbi:MAG: hypothetical protein Q9207_007863 [Kuettlingeria erythrocarpa]